MSDADSNALSHCSSSASDAGDASEVEALLGDHEWTWAKRDRSSGDGVLLGCSGCDWTHEPSGATGLGWRPHHAHLASLIVAREAAAAAQARDEERAAWSSWLDNWMSAVGPEPPTVEAVATWLRADQRPFGVTRGDS